MSFVVTPPAWPKVLTGRADTIAANPFDLDAAVRTGAFGALKKAAGMGASSTIDLIAAAGLRGRGGAGFPAADKWRMAAGVDADQRYLVANGYGADPGSHTDASLLAADPWAVLEGMAIAALAIGATEAILAVRADDASLVAKLEGAVLAAEEAGYLGDDAAGSGRRVTVTVRALQGTYMLGEETVLIKSLEGRRAQPRTASAVSGPARAV